ncbi:MAG: C-terminal helicase domain-containing protein, partial [Myxococcota bacterium]
VAKPSPLVDALPPRLQSSCWLHVEARAKKWSAEEGHAASEILTRLLTSGLGDPSIYFISPFREVALQLREVLRPIAGKDWVKHHVGTIHTFQGKEADIVCLVLGASAESSQGSRSWAGRSPNILNVAVTRAKRLLIIIGHQDAWKHAGVFRLAVSPQRLPRVEYSPSLFVEPVVPSPAQGPKRVSQDGSPPAAGSS